MELEEAEERGLARQVLRAGYKSDVELLAQEMAARVRRGDFDNNYPWFEGSLDGAVRKHPRVTDQTRVFETVAFSDNRNAIEQDFIEGWSEELDGPWANFQLPIDPDVGEPYDITLPAWAAIAYHAFYRDVSQRIYEVLGDEPEQYIATRLGHDWK
jgi:hypothetical protein